MWDRPEYLEQNKNSENDGGVVISEFPISFFYVLNPMGDRHSIRSGENSLTDRVRNPILPDLDKTKQDEFAQKNWHIAVV